MLAVSRPLAAAALCLTCVGGCASFPTVRLLDSSPAGGVAALPNNTDVWPTFYRSKAEVLMARACPKGYVIDHEGEVVTRPETPAACGRDRTPPYEYNGVRERIDAERKEYHIHFHSRPPDAPAAPVAGPD